MSWTYVRALADSRSGFTQQCPAHAPSVTSSATTTPSPSSKLASRTDSLTTPPSGMTCAPSTGVPGVDSWIASLRATRAKESHLQASAPAPTMSAGCGLTSGASFARWTPDGWRSRTLQATLPGLGVESVEGWPRAGGVLSGIAYQRQPLAPRTSAIEYSLSLHRQWLTSLLPTPTAASYGSNRSPSAGSTVHYSLQYLAKNGLLPTPTASDARKSSEGRSRQGGVSLTAAVVGFGCRSGTVHRRLNPAFIEWMMGFRAGWTETIPEKRRLAVLGNACVPQAAELAFKTLFQRMRDDNN